MKYISNTNLTKFLDGLNGDYQVFFPVKKGENRFFKKYDGCTDDMVVGEVRAFEPLKAFFSKARKQVSEDFADSMPLSGGKPFAVVGVKACDLKGFKVQDYVFRDADYKDPFYIKNREENLVISADCTCTKDTCFCLALGVEPYPRESFDINLSQLKEGYLVETGSEKGKSVINKYSDLFEEAPGNLNAERDQIRAKVTREVEKNIDRNNVPHQDLFEGIIEKNFKSGIWEDEAKTCVECGACNNICPTCHCFLLYDQQDEAHMARLSVWDSCMVKDYARVAGGANPRKRLWMRLRNRFEKKFDFFHKVAQVYACTGCGRCISACPAKIDIREVLKKLVNNA